MKRLFFIVVIVVCFAVRAHAVCDLPPNDQRIQACEEMVGANHLSKSDTLNRALMVSHNNDGTQKTVSNPSWLTGLAWSKLLSFPSVCPAGQYVYAVGTSLTCEAPAQIGTLTNTKWCTSDGSQIICNTNAPVITESDPQVGSVTNTYFCKGTGTQVSCTDSTAYVPQTTTVNGHALTGNVTVAATDLTGVLTVAHGGTGANTLTGYLKGNGTGPVTAVATIGTADLTGVLSTDKGGTGVTDLTFSGNTSKVGTVSGTLASNHCAKFDASGNIVDAGDTCGTGGGGLVGSWSGNTTVGASTSAHVNVNCTAASTPYACCTGAGTGTCNADIENYVAVWDVNGNVTTRPLGESSDSYLPTSPFNITAANGTYQDTGLYVILPAAGTYLVFTNVRASVLYTGGSEATITAKLWNASDSADLVGYGSRLVVQHGTTGVKQEGSAMLQVIATVTGIKTVRLYVMRNKATAWTTSQILSDTDGRTVLSYIRIK